MNKKGFTLVELIATISIMLLITVMAIPSVISLLSKSDDKLDNAIKKQLVSYAKTYMKDNDYINNIELFFEEETYCVLVSELTDENFVDQDNNEVNGRIEIKKDGNKFTYGYNSSNNVDDCYEFPSLYTIQDETEITLTPNKEADIDPESVKGKLIDLYDITEEIPDFKIKAPTDSTIATNKYREKKEEFTNDYSNGSYFFETNQYPYTLYPRKCSTSEYDERNEGISNLNVKSYFGKSYSFDKSTGTYTLNTTVHGYMNTENPIDNGYVYICDNHSTTCTTMYEIVEYDCSNIYYSNYGKCTRLCKGKSGYKYTARNQYDNKDSGLYKAPGMYDSIYYFRGAVTNNYIKFAGSDIIFQILRFNPDNSIRLVSTTPAGGTASYNGAYADTYSDSNLKSELEGWYVNEMQQFEDYIVPGEYCVNKIIKEGDIDRGLYRTDPIGDDWNVFMSPYEDALMLMFEAPYRLDYSNEKLNPTFSCDNPLIAKVGTLSADEVVFAGGVPTSIYSSKNPSSSNMSNTDFFLYREGGYHTLTGVYRSSRHLVNESDLGGISTYRFIGDENNGYLGDGTDRSTGQLPVYPVISIRGDVKVTGSGTKNYPFEIITSSIEYR